MSRKVGENVGMCMTSKLFSVGKLVLYRYYSWECKECTHAHSSLMILASNMGRRCLEDFPIEKHGR